MNIACVSDTHGRDWKAPLGVDLLLHAGDGMMSGERDSELRTIAHQLGELVMPVVYVAGNHDFYFERYPKRAAAMLPPNTTYLCDEEVTINGLRIYGSPWQPWFCDWAFNLPRNGPGLRAKWAAIPEGLDILVTHGPPMGVLDCNAAGKHVGCELLAQRLCSMDRPPRLHVFGHIHEGYGDFQDVRTLFVNASLCDIRYRAVNPPRIVRLTRREDHEDSSQEVRLPA